MSIVAYVIGLERNYRGAELEAQLSSLGIDHRRSPGVEVNHQGVPVASFTEPDLAASIYGRALTAGEIGCALAHRVCYQGLLDSGDEWALVFEDDARVVRPRALEEVVRRVGALEEFDRPVVFMLYGRQMVGDPRLHAQFQHSDIHELFRTPMTATAYLINRVAARYILDTGLPLRNPADWPVSVEGHVRFVAAYPWPVAPDEAGQASSIGGRGSGRSGLAWLADRLGAVSHMKWLRHRQHYRSLAEFRHWEIRRRLVPLVPGPPLPYRVPDGAASLPIAGRLAVATDRLLGGSRDIDVVEYLLGGVAASGRVGCPPGEADVTLRQQSRP